MGEQMLTMFVFLLAIIVIVSILNEKYFHLQNEIALLCSSLFLSGIYIIFNKIMGNNGEIAIFPMNLLDQFLVEGFLCFMLFSGSYDLYYWKLASKAKPVILLSLLTTLLSALLYAGLFYGAIILFQVEQIGFLQCFLLGCIISPTDPIAAMSILKKVGLPEDVAVTIEGESLFNDGVGLALFVSVSTAISHNQTQINPVSFASDLLVKIFGAVGISFVISYILFQIFRRTKDESMQIFTSILAVSSAYVICEMLDVSGAIAAVVCGIYFATKTKEYEQDEISKSTTPSLAVYHDFWSSVDSLLNSLLYVLLGITFLNLYGFANQHLAIMGIGILCNFFARYFGVFVSGVLIKKKPGGYGIFSFANLMTYAGLKGALSLALAINTAEILTDDLYHTILSVTFAIVLFTTIGQGLTIGKFYKKFYGVKTEMK